MKTKTIAGALTVLCGCAVASASSSHGRPPQTGFYCVDIPHGHSAEAGRFVQAVGDRLHFKVSEAEFPGLTSRGPPNHVWEIYGGGVSMFVGTAMKGGGADRYGNREVTFNPHRLGLNVAKTGQRQSVRFRDVVTAARNAATERGWAWSKAAPGRGCST